MMGLEASTFSSTLVSFAEPPTVAKKRMPYFAETVLPAPDSPLTIIDWFFSSLQKNIQVYMCDENSIPIIIWEDIVNPLLI